MKIISRILKFFGVIEIGRTILEKAVQSDIKDFEDAVIAESARNIKDFKNSPVPVMLPEDYLV